MEFFDISTHCWDNGILKTILGHFLEANAKLNIEFCEKSFSYSLYIHQNEFIKFSAGEKSLGGEHPTIYAMSVQVEPPVWWVRGAHGQGWQGWDLGHSISIWYLLKIDWATVPHLFRLPQKCHSNFSSSLNINFDLKDDEGWMIVSVALP